MHVLDANELFGITSYTYDRIMEIGGKYGPDAFALYFKLMKQARIQQTNQTYTLNKFLENYFGWGHERLTKAKKILKGLGLVDDVILRDEKGIITGHYVRVNYLIDENKIRNQGITYNLSTSLETQDMDTPTSGGMATNALSNINNKCLKEYNKNASNFSKQEDSTTLEENNNGGDLTFDKRFEKYWDSYPRVRTRKKETIYSLFKQLTPEEQEEIRKDALIYKIEYEQDSSVDKAKYVKGIDSYIKDYNIDDYREDKLVNIIKRNKQLRDLGDSDKRIKKFKQLYEVFGEDRCKELWIENTKSKVQDLIKGMGLN